MQAGYPKNLLNPFIHMLCLYAPAAIVHIPAPPDQDTDPGAVHKFRTGKIKDKAAHPVRVDQQIRLHAELLRRIEDEDSARVCECGAYVFLDQSYCPRCGKKLDWKLFQ